MINQFNGNWGNYRIFGQAYIMKDICLVAFLAFFVVLKPWTNNEIHLVPEFCVFHFGCLLLILGGSLNTRTALSAFRQRSSQNLFVWEHWNRKDWILRAKLPSVPVYLYFKIVSNINPLNFGGFVGIVCGKESRAEARFLLTSKVWGKPLIFSQGIWYV